MSPQDVTKNQEHGQGRVYEELVLSRSRSDLCYHCGRGCWRDLVSMMKGCRRRRGNGKAYRGMMRAGMTGCFDAGSAGVVRRGCQGARRRQAECAWATEDNERERRA